MLLFSMLSISFRSSISITTTTICLVLISIFLTTTLTNATSIKLFTLGKNRSQQLSSQHHHYSHHHHDQQHGGGESQRVVVGRPKIGVFLKDFKGSSVRDLSSQRFGSDDIILPYLQVEDNIWEGFSIQLQCNFTRPIQWIYAGDGAPAVKTESYRIAPDIYNSSNYIYGASVIFTHTDYKQTGRYTCQSIAQPRLHSDLFVFVPGKKIFVSDDADGHEEGGNIQENVTEIVIHGDPFSRWIKLPCSVSNPNASVQLFKDGHEIPLARKKIYFEPKIGFELSRDNLTNPWGKYLCLEEQTGQRLAILVQAPKYVLAGEMMMAPPGKKGNRITTVDSDEPFLENEEKDKALTHLKFNYDKRRELVMCCAFDMHGQSIKHYPKLKSASCDSVNECQIIRKHLNNRKCPPGKEACEGKKLKRHCVGYEFTDFDDAGVIECSLSGHYESQEYFQFSKVGETVFTDFDVIPSTEKILKIIAEDSPAGDGRKLLTCQLNSFFFSRGIKWAFKNETSDLTFLQEGYPAKISVDINPEEINSVYCFAPLWRNSEWRNVSISYPYN